MNRKTIQFILLLDKEEKKMLEKLSEHNSTSMASIVRKAIKENYRNTFPQNQNQNQTTN